jgi:hypothetical protein
VQRNNSTGNDSSAVWVCRLEWHTGGRKDAPNQEPEYKNGRHLAGSTVRWLMSAM